MRLANVPSTIGSNINTNINKLSKQSDHVAGYCRQPTALPRAFKLAIPAPEVQGARVKDASEEKRATKAIVGECPTMRPSIEGMDLGGLLDTESQVTLMQQSLFEQHFAQTKLQEGPPVFKLRAANGSLYQLHSV